MPSEVLPDVLSGLVAAGTLALAGATVFLGRATAKAAVDAGSPRVFVAWFATEDLCEGPAAKAKPIEPGTPWDMARNGQDPIGLRAWGRLRNDSSVTALFRFELGADCEITGVTRASEHPSAGPEMRVAIQPQEGWYGIGPAGSARFHIIWWQHAQTWAAAWSGGASGSAPAEPPPITTTRVFVRGAFAGAEDRCDLTFGGFAFVPRPGDNGLVTAAVKSSGSIPVTPEPVASIGLMRRSYGNRFGAWHWPWRADRAERDSHAGNQRHG